MCVCSCTRKIKGGHESVYVCVSGIITLPSTATCVRMYANTAERLRLHKTVILLLIMKYFVLKLVYFHTTTPCNPLSSHRKKKIKVKRFHLI